MPKLIAKSALALTAIVAVSGNAIAADMLLEERIARQEESMILTSPIAGIQNRFWFDYLGDIVEAQEELASDLNRASDLEDLRDAWEEYAHELRDEREHYIEEMAERGYRHYTITVE